MNENYPPEFYDEDGTLNFPDFFPRKSDYILQARYNGARAGTVAGIITVCYKDASFYLKPHYDLGVGLKRDEQSDEPISSSPRYLWLTHSQAHYACARESTVFELGALPAEAVARQGSGRLSCSLGVRFLS